MRRYALTEEQWEKIQEELPSREGYVGENSGAIISVPSGYPVEGFARKIRRLSKCAKTSEPLE